jgi:diacylglycerol kinase (ATP)
MDRWQLSVTRNSNLPSTEDKGEDQLPRSANVVNNYFSLGVDAQIALQFHEAREANPQKFNSRIRNKMYYGLAGGKVIYCTQFFGMNAVGLTLRIKNTDKSNNLLH